MAVEKKNIFLSNTIELLPYASRSKPGSRKIPMRGDVDAHASYLKRKLEEAYTQSRNQKQVAAVRY